MSGVKNSSLTLLFELSELGASELLPNPCIDLGPDELAHSFVGFACADEVEAKVADAEDVETEDAGAEDAEVHFAEAVALEVEDAEADEGGDLMEWDSLRFVWAKLSGNCNLCSCSSYVRRQNFHMARAILCTSLPSLLYNTAFDQMRSTSTKNCATVL